MSAPKTILLLEDEENVRSFVRTYLQSEGYNVIEAANGKEGLALLAKQKTDLIVSDVMMPEMDGIEFFKEIRRTPKFKDVPVIMLTVKDEFNDIKYAYLLGVEEYLTKPFDPGVLVHHIKRILEKGVPL